jgi:hypothetical protein
MREEVDGEHGLLTGEKTTTGREGFLKEKTTPASINHCHRRDEPLSGGVAVENGRRRLESLYLTPVRPGSFCSPTRSSAAAPLPLLRVCRSAECRLNPHVASRREEFFHPNEAEVSFPG